MTNSEILILFSSINCARLGDGYAPHKPILILLLLERVLNGPRGIKQIAKQLLIEIGTVYSVI
jgi:hypothetical protein